MTPITVRQFYLIATYGKKPGENVMHCQAVSGQIANLRFRFPPDSDQKDRFLWDYARKIQNLNDLPKLSAFLKKVANFAGGALVIDDISRVFRICEISGRTNLLAELQPFSDRIFSLQHKSKLSGLSETQKRCLILVPEKSIIARRLKSSKIERADATEEARIASIISRQSAATIRNAQIAELQLELSAAGKPSGSVDVAQAANERLLRTSRGLPWSSRSVRDALRDATCQEI